MIIHPLNKLSIEEKNQLAATLRSNIERFVDAVMDEKYPIGDLLNESFTMEMLDLLFKRMTIKLRGVLFSRKMTLDLIAVAMDPSRTHHTRMLATSFIVIGSAANSLVICKENDHKCELYWHAVFDPLLQEANGIRPSREEQEKDQLEHAQLEEIVNIAIKDIAEDGAKTLKSSFTIEKYEAQEQSQHSSSTISIEKEEIHENEGSSPTSVHSDLSDTTHEERFSELEAEHVKEQEELAARVEAVAHDNAKTFTGIFSADTANFTSQLLQYFAVHGKKGACILYYLSENASIVDLLLGNIGHDDIRTFLLHLIYSDHSDQAIKSLFASQLMKKMVQRLLYSTSTPKDEFERDCIENTFLLLREILHAPYLTSRGVAISAKTIPLDKVTGQDEYMSICGASRELANSAFRKYTSRKVRHLISLFLSRNEHAMEQLFTQMIRELTFWSSGQNSGIGLLQAGHPRPACTTMLIHLFEMTESVELMEEQVNKTSSSCNAKAKTSLGIDCKNFMCSTHLVKSGQVSLKRKIKNEISQCILSINCMMGLLIATLREERDLSSSHQVGEGFLSTQKGGFVSITLDEIEAIETSDWHKFGFILHVKKRRNEPTQLNDSGSKASTNDNNNGENPPQHHGFLSSHGFGHAHGQIQYEKTIEYFAVSSEEERTKWMNTLEAVISGDLNELEVFCSDDWRSNVQDYKQLREQLIHCMERFGGHELTAFLRQAVMLSARKTSGYHLWTICKLLYTIVTNESKRLDRMFVNSHLFEILLTCYEKFPRQSLLLSEITKLIVFYFADAKRKRSSKCPVISHLLLTPVTIVAAKEKNKDVPNVYLFNLLQRTLVHKDNKLAGTDAYSNLRLIYDVLKMYNSAPDTSSSQHDGQKVVKTRSQQNMASLLVKRIEWQQLFKDIEAATAKPTVTAPKISNSTSSTAKNPTVSNSIKSTKPAPSTPAFQDTIIEQITKPCYSSSYGWGSSFLLGEGCAFGYLFKKRRERDEWQKALVVFEHVSYKLWYFYPSEVDEANRITWKWIVPLAVKARYVHGQDENHTVIGHHGLCITAYDHLTNTATKELHFSVTKLDDRDHWRQVLENACKTIQQLTQDYSQMSVKLKKPDKSKVTHCPGCEVPFKLFRRPHACRRCGRWFCGKCTSLRKAIPEVGLMTPVRHCEPCFNASGGTQAELEPIQLFTSSIHTNSPTSTVGSQDESRNVQRESSSCVSSFSLEEMDNFSILMNAELFELAHGRISPRTMMDMSRRSLRLESVDSPRAAGIRGIFVDEVDNEEEDEHVGSYSRSRSRYVLSRSDSGGGDEDVTEEEEHVAPWKSEDEEEEEAVTG